MVEKVTNLSFSCEKCGWFQSLTAEEERLLDEHIKVLYCEKCNYKHRNFEDLKNYSYATRDDKG